MKSLTEYIKENLTTGIIFEGRAHNVFNRNIIDWCKENKNFKLTPVFNDILPEATLLIFNETTGDLLDEYVLKNNPDNSFVFIAKLSDNGAKAKYSKSYRNGQISISSYGDYKEDPTYPTWGKGDQNSPISLQMINKTAGIQILVANKDNIDIVKQVIKEHIDEFKDVAPKSTPLTKDEIDVLTEWFEDNVKNVEVITKNNTFAAYFPNREQAKQMNRTGLSNIPHLTISRPAGMKGNLKITLYKEGNRDASEWPDLRRMMDKDGNPKYATVDSIIYNALDKNFKNSWAERLGAELK